jgi:hypothetical protein
MRKLSLWIDHRSVAPAFISGKLHIRPSSDPTVERSSYASSVGALLDFFVVFVMLSIGLRVRGCL